MNLNGIFDAVDASIESNESSVNYVTLYDGRVTQIKNGICYVNKNGSSVKCYAKNISNISVNNLVHVIEKNNAKTEKDRIVLEGYLTDIGSISVGWSDITGKPNTYTPSLHIHSISDVTGLQESIPTKTSDLTNDSNFISSIPSEYVTETELDNKGYLTDVGWSDITGKPNTYTPSLHIHSISDVTGLQESIPTKTSDLTNDSNFISSIPSEYVTETELDNKGYLTTYTETDPTVPFWAKQSTKPSYTASEVGADTSGSAKTVQDNLDTHMEDLVSHLSSNEHTNFTDAVSKKHSHSNKSVLDGITSTLISDWNNAVSHSNDLSIHITTGEKDKLSNIEDNANNYSLPTASSNILGGVKTGSNITNSSGTISLTQANVIAALGYTPSSTSSAGFPTIVAKTKPTTATANSCFIKLNI